LTCALLKDDALQLFDERAIKLSVKKDNYKEEKMDHILYLHSISNLPPVVCVSLTKYRCRGEEILNT
jgi:hypothetical protein